VIAAFGWGALGAAALLVGAVVAYATRPSQRVIAVVMALGAGLLIGSVAFELVEEALETSTVGQVSPWVLLGALAFVVGDTLVERWGGGHRKDSTGAGRAGGGAALAIVLGSVLDGIPESYVLGLTVDGGVSPALLAGILLSNLPEGMASSAGLRASGWPLQRVVLMWSVVVVASGLAAMAGYATLQGGSGPTASVAQAFAAGALLTMLTDTLLPESYRVEGARTGLLVTIGFAGSFALSSL
jgi:ZIP family zinc transporter